MASIGEIRTALKTRLDTINGLNVYDKVPGQVLPPAVVIRRRRGPVPATFGSVQQDYTFSLTVITSLADDTLGQEKLDEFLSGAGANAIVAALDADNDLGSVVEYAHVSEVEADTIFEFGQQSYLGAEVVVEVGAS